MKKPLYSFLLWIGSIYLMGCSSFSPFTKGVMQEIDHQQYDISTIQFYNSQKITLERIINPPEEVTIKQGKIRLSGEETHEVIEIKKGTPGICTIQNGDRLQISFEENNYLTFILKLNGTFHLQNEQFSRQDNVVIYNDTYYRIKQAPHKIHLMINKNFREKLSKSTRKAKGVKVDD